MASPSSTDFESRRLRDLLLLEGRDALSADDVRVGKVSGVLVDRERGTPQWLLLDRRRQAPVAVPFADSLALPSAVRLAVSSTLIHNAPTFGLDVVLTARAERDLCEHYDRPLTAGAQRARWERRRTTARLVDRDGVPSWEPGPREGRP